MPPNILYIHSHDTGRYVQPYGHAIPTPNIQWLADQGIMFRNAFCAAPSCSGSRAALLTGEYCHTNGMMGLAHRGFSLNDYDHQLVRVLMAHGYHSELIGEQHISADPHVLGYDVVHEIPDTRVHSVGPAAIEALRSGIREPFFMSVGFFETHRSFFAPSSVRDRVYSLPPPFLPDTPEIREDVAAYKASARSLDHGVGTRPERAAGDRARRAHAGDLHHRPRAGLPDRQGEPARSRDRRQPDRPRARLHRRARASTSSCPISTSSRRSARWPACRRRRGCVGHSLLPLVAGEEEPGHPLGDLLRADLPRRLRAAAGDPHRALQVHPPVRRLPLPGAAQLRRQPEQGRLSRRAAGRRARSPASRSTTCSSTPAKVAT